MIYASYIAYLCRIFETDWKIKSNLHCPQAAPSKENGNASFFIPKLNSTGIAHTIPSLSRPLAVILSTK